MLCRFGGPRRSTTKSNLTTSLLLGDVTVVRPHIMSSRLPQCSMTDCVYATNGKRDAT